MLERMIRALRPEGICYLSFKEGDGERLQGDRLFSDFTEVSLKACLAQSRQQNTDQQRQYGDHDQQLNKRKRISFFHKKTPS